ncbi:DNA-binding domain-containing protein [Variovorax sp. dw_954]|uniref:HvfC/BufC family peptide modification chaperone n=1 Tax=unclassified Variovorax TaxID=663243 RepID=UPI001BD28B82
MKLADFQSGFATTLFDPGIATGLASQPAFAVYRNTVMKGCIDALEANYPSVARLVGSDWFRAAAAVHVVERPPRNGRLQDYGADFADFLAAFEPASGLPYLPGVARLDNCWTQAHTAADANAIDGAWLAGLSPEALGSLRVAPHPAARWQWFPDAPIYTIWQRNRSASDDTAEIEWQPEGALLTRPQDAVTWREATLAVCAFLDACAEGKPLGDAAAAALAAQPDADLADLLAGLLHAGALVVSPTLESTP